MPRYGLNQRVRPYANLGIAAARTRNFEVALPALVVAVRCHRRSKNSFGIAMALYSLASTLADIQAYFRAERFFGFAATWLERAGLPKLADDARGRIAMINDLLPEDTNGLGYRAYDSTRAAFVDNMERSRLSYQSGNRAGAAWLLRNALREARILGDQSAIVTCEFPKICR